MPDSIDDYLRLLLEQVTSSPLVHSSRVLLDKRTQQAGLIKGDLYFANGSRLHFRELVELQDTVTRLMYTYHYQQESGVLIFR